LYLRVLQMFFLSALLLAFDRFLQGLSPGKRTTKDSGQVILLSRGFSFTYCLPRQYLDKVVDRGRDNGRTYGRISFKHALFASNVTSWCEKPNISTCRDASTERSNLDFP